jgi:hypothetical protein
MRKGIEVSAIAAAEVAMVAEFKLKNDREEVRGLRSRI